MENHGLLNSSSAIATGNTVHTCYLKWTNQERVLYYLVLGNIIQNLQNS